MFSIAYSITLHNKTQNVANVEQLKSDGTFVFNPLHVESGAIAHVWVCCLNCMSQYNSLLGFNYKLKCNIDWLICYRNTRSTV